jgi:type II secretory pathway component PulF
MTGVSKNLQIKFLNNLESMLDLGFSITQSIESIEKYEKNKQLKGLLKKIIKDSKTKFNTPLLLKKYKLIDDTGYNILKYSENQQSGVKSILEILEGSSNIELELVKGVISPLMFIYAFFGITVIGKDPLEEAINGFLRQLGSAIKDTNSFEWPFWFDPTIQMTLQFSMWGLSIILILIPILYSILLFSDNIKLFYNRFKFKQYEEVEKYFNLMLKIHNTQGMGVLKVLNILRKAYESNKRLLKLTKESEKFVERGEMYFRALNKFGIDERITGMVEIGEKTSNLWPNISKSIKYAKMLKEEKVNQIKKVFGALKTIATIAVIMAMIQLILIIVSVQQLVISSMT